MLSIKERCIKKLNRLILDNEIYIENKQNDIKKLEQSPPIAIDKISTYEIIKAELRIEVLQDQITEYQSLIDLIEMI